VRTAGPMAIEDRRTFRAAVDTMTESWIWELTNQLQNRIPDPVDYIEMRRRTFGSDLTMSLCRIGHGRTVPPQIYRSRVVRALESSAADYACLLNDVFSYQKEIQFEGEFHNAVMVVQNFLGCDRDTALGLVNDLMTARMQQFEQLVTVDLPTMFEDFGLSEEVRKTLTGYAEELQNWMSGILVWHRGCDRYDEPSLLRRAGKPITEPVKTFHIPQGATGLGTSAAKTYQLAGAKTAQRMDGAL
jgi:germacradienol/geosmin synthase